MSLNIGLIGFGRTGSIVAKEIVADQDLNLKWVCRNSIPENQKFASHSLGFNEGFAPFVEKDKLTDNFIKKNPVDLVIDFSSGSSANSYDLFARNNIKIVSAISKYSEAELVLIQAASEKTAILASPNITLGINWLLIASKVLKKIIPNSDVEIVEEHFREKKETSGTAIKIAEHLNIEPEKHVNSIRVGGILGKHEVIFGLQHQTIRLTHESISRSAFGTGAIFAAKWVAKKNHGLFKMEHLIHEKFLKHVTNLEL